MLLLFIAIFIITLAAIYFLRSSQLSIHASIKNSFSNVGERGGILVSMFSNSDAKKILDKNVIEYSDFDQCASINRKTCSAFSLFRRDLWCCPFITPGTNMCIGVILKTDTFWPLLTGAFVIDANTNSRVACSNENGSDINVNYGCIQTAFGDGDLSIKSSDSGFGPSKCAPSDEKCRYLNSGGGLNLFNIIQGGIPCDCATPSADGKYVSFDSCDVCDKLYVCSSTEPTSPMKPNPYYNDSDITAYLGTDSRLWNKMFTNDSLDIGYTSTTQCKFKKENLKGWKDALYNFYTLLLSKNFPFNPTAPSYLENELNAYIYPDNTDQIYKDQQKIFLNSIQGFFYIGNKCEAQLVGGSLFPEEDCNIVTSSIDTASRHLEESNEMLLARTNTIALAKLVSSTTKNRVAVYKAILDSNTFPNKKGITDAMNGKVDFDSLFTSEEIY